MKIKTLKLIFVLTALLSFTGINAQTEDAKWNFGIHGGFNTYNGDLGSGFFNTDQALYGFGAISFARYINPHFDVVLNGSSGEVGYVEDANGFRARMNTATINLRYSFFHYGEKVVRPYVYVGVGYMGFNDLKVDEDDVINNTALPSFGGGLTFRIDDSWNLLIQESFLYSDYDKIDNEAKDINDLYLQHTLGLTYNFGKAKDDDMDGIPNSKDKCPQVKGTEALNGCPDTDGDGITDKNDACPSVAGLKQFLGCPDTDGDGIADKDDACPEVAGLKALNGCPDTDGDGVADKEDACPEVAGLKELEGCPDTDGDGIADKDDQCPNKSGAKEMNGCPDSDGDGVADNVDKCPEVAGISANKGCPEVKEEEIELLKRALNGIKFETGKDIIRKASFGILDNVVNIMKENPAYKLKIDGHTDSQGNEAKNMTLSIDRAKAVKNHLIENGIDQSRLTSEGFGITKPVADNKTSAGRAQNRRVELTVEF